MAQKYEYSLTKLHVDVYDLDFSPTLEGVREIVNRYFPDAQVEWSHARELKIISPKPLPDTLVFKLQQVGTLKIYNVTT